MERNNENVSDKSVAIGQHKITLNDRKKCNITGVIDTLFFDVECVALDTKEGRLTIKGDKLHVSRVDLERGEVDFEGRVDSVVYADKAKITKKGESLINRLLS